MFKNETRTAGVPRALGCDEDTESPGLRGRPGGLSQREGQARVEDALPWASPALLPGGLAWGA